MAGTYKGFVDDIRLWTRALKSADVESNYARILGGTEDGIVSGEASRELASRIPGSLLHMFEGYSHGAFEQAPDFHEWILDFFTAPDESVRKRI